MNIDHRPLGYSVKGAIQASSLGKTKIYSLIKEGRLEITKIDGRTVVKGASLHRLMTERRRPLPNGLARDRP